MLLLFLLIFNSTVTATSAGGTLIGDGGTVATRYGDGGAAPPMKPLNQRIRIAPAISATHLMHVPLMHVHLMHVPT